MFQDAGLQQKDFLTYSDFKLMMKEYKGDFVAIGLDCKGAKQNFLDTSTNVARCDDHSSIQNRNYANVMNHITQLS
jgi:dual oxidase